MPLRSTISARGGTIPDSAPASDGRPQKGEPQDDDAGDADEHQHHHHQAEMDERDSLLAQAREPLAGGAGDQCRH
jgi:hypothetical protein